MRHDQRGVTLTEILIIIALLAMLTLISIPSLVNAKRVFEVRGSAAGLAAGFRRAQGMAMQEHKGMIVFVNPIEGSTSPRFCWPTPGTGRAYAIVEDAGGDCKIAACPAASGERVREWGPALPSSVSFVRFPSGEPIDIGGASGTDTYQTLCFTSRGYLSSQTPELTGVYVGIKVKNMYRRVQVGLTGRVSVQRYTGGTYQEQ